MPSTHDLDTTFAALSAGTRRAILDRLKDGEIRLSDLASPFDMTQTAVSKHVNVLSDAGLVIIEKRGRSKHCRLNAAHLQDVSDWLEEYRAFWGTQMTNLGLFLAKEDAT
ncbi:MAG: metalloregulator ArsR/SmtB family transcription factor [Sulfitobacter sp.]